MEFVLDKENLELYNKGIQQNLERDGIMEKEKILEAARVDKNRGKEFENKQAVRGSLISALFALFVGIGLFCLECIMKGTLNFGLVAVGMTAVGAQYLYEGITVKKVHMIILGVIYSVLALFFVLAFIGQVVSA